MSVTPVTPVTSPSHPGYGSGAIPPHIATFGEPGGLYFVLDLDFDRETYVVYNEGGDDIYASPSEQSCRDWIADCIAREEPHARS
jgi:hypothetical protein